MATAPHAGLAARYRDDPERGRVRVRVATELADGMRCSTTARSHVVHADEPRSLGGTDTAQSPVELILTSLATCQAVTYRLWASELGTPLDRVAVEVEGAIDLRGFLGVADVPAGYDAVTIRVSLEGPAPAAEYQRLADAVDAHCPVYDVLRRPVAVTRELELPAAT